MCDVRNAIEMKELTKRYGRNRGIEGISLNVEQGDFFGYLGVNGAGKSTSVRCLLGLVQITSGEAYVLGKKVGDKQQEILRQVGYVPSEAHFYPSMRVEEVIRYAARLRGLDCGVEADKLCDRLFVDRKKRIRELSLGNRKKVSIVCALQHRPGLVILDEPTSGLDPLMQEAFFELLSEYNKEGMTCFLSSHVLQEVKRYCRHVAILRDGRLVKADTVEHLAGSSLRKVKVCGLETLPFAAGMMGVVKKGEDFEFSFQGEISELLGALQGLPIKDLLIEEPSLEEIFMQYYERE